MREFRSIAQGFFTDYNEIKKGPVEYEEFLLETIGFRSLSHNKSSNNYYLLPNGKMYDCEWGSHEILLRILYLDGIASSDDSVEAEELGYIKVSQNSIYIPKFPVSDQQYKVLENMFLENNNYLYLYGKEYTDLDSLYNYLKGDKI